MILTFGTSMILLLSACAAILGVGLLDTTYNIFRRWKKSNSEERYELEKGFYLILAAACIALALRLTIVPLYFWTMQSFVPMIPGAMCLWGVFNALPEFTWPALILKLILPSLYASWLILALINARCKRNQLVGNLAGFFILIVPFLLVDSILDLLVFVKLTPIQVSCCSNAIDVGPRPIPPPIGAISGQTIMLLLFILCSTIFAASAFLSTKKQNLEWIARGFAIALIPITILTMTEILTPWILHLPFHYCPFCLLSNSPSSIPFVFLYWIAISASWWTLATRKLCPVDQEASVIEKGVRTKLLSVAWSSSLIGLLIVLVSIATSFT
jgi:hypothetical protein